MIIDFNDLQIPFHRLAVGTVLINPDDIRYLKSIGEDMEYYWVYGMDLWSNQAHSDAELLKDIGDDEGWKVLP